MPHVDSPHVPVPHPYPATDTAGFVLISYEAFVPLTLTALAEVAVPTVVIIYCEVERTSTISNSPNNCVCVIPFTTPGVPEIVTKSPVIAPCDASVIVTLDSVPAVVLVVITVIALVADLIGVISDHAPLA